jgi:hypothetical protein
MGCKCANSEKEDEEEIHQNSFEETNNNNNINNENTSNNNNKKEDLLGINNQNKTNIATNPGNNEENNENISKGPEENMTNTENNRTYNKYEKYANYPEKIVDLINNIRGDPVGYTNVIEDSIKNITEEEDKNDPSIVRLIFKKKVKVALNRGEAAFREAINILRTLSPLPPLEFSKEICIPLPENEEELNDTTFLREQVKKIRENYEIDVFYKDLIKIPEVSALLMIVDDSTKNAGKKRLALLNKDIKYVGVTSKFIGKTFIAYFSFSK